MTSLVFVPVDRAEALALRVGADLGDRPGCAPTAGLAGGLEPTAVAEEVEFAALSYAGVLALRAGSDPRRLVLAADVADGQITDQGSELGEVTVAGLRWIQVQALFADEPAAEPAVDRARADVAGLSLVEAAAIEAVAALQGEFDLLWFALDELDRLPL
ncbi:MAG TPA: hypothetical protein VGW74_22585 [Propionibacteriaceae bacterium]|nr:hypothetical protein [Propionibacteriaceae bacterium]